MCVEDFIVNFQAPNRDPIKPVQENPGASVLTHRMAGIGNWGKHPQNVERDLNRILGIPLVLGRENTKPKLG